jgi:hypothetical protein
MTDLDQLEVLLVAIKDVQKTENKLRRLYKRENEKYDRKKFLPVFNSFNASIRNLAEMKGDLEREINYWK